MKVSTTWIKEMLCRTMSDDEVVAALERAGIEIEQYSYSKPLDENIVVGLVKKVVQHPQADRLRLAEVQVGESLLHIVCGAPNLAEGQKVAVAQIGTTLPSGDTITPAKLRGEVSEGMLCSEHELELSSNHDGILVIDDKVKLGTRLCDLYATESFVDVKTPANRSDLLSVMGLAREVAAMSSTPLKDMFDDQMPDAPRIKVLSSEIVSKRYVLAKFSVDADAPTLPRMTARLRAAGMRSVSGLVDVTNYVMLESGQPLHAFDAAKVKLPISVRPAHEGETLVTLDGVKRDLSVNDLVIADTTGPIALAGVMGGAATEVTAKTTEILLELSTFDASTVRKSAQRHGLRSEASGRFERQLPSDLIPVALNLATDMLGEVANAKLIGLADHGEPKAKPHPIALTMKHLTKILGISLETAEAIEALSRLQIAALSDKTGSTLTVKAAPWWRPDLALPEDLIEEIVRVIGYDRIPATLPSWRPARVEFDRNRSKQRQLRELLLAAGLFEVLTYSFVAEDQLAELHQPLDAHLKLQNPLSSEQGYLRSSLLASHLAVLERNRTYAKQLGFYEISKVFVPRSAGEQPDEPLTLGVTMVAPKGAYGKIKGIFDALASAFFIDATFEVKALSGLAQGRGAVISAGGHKLGQIGQIDPVLTERRKLSGEAMHLEINLDNWFELAATRAYAGLDRFPAIRRDLAVIVPEALTWQDVREILGQKLAAQVEYLGEYYGDELPAGHKSLTLRLTLTHPDRTPTEAEANDLLQRVLNQLVRKAGAKARD